MNANEDSGSVQLILNNSNDTNSCTKLNDSEIAMNTESKPDNYNASESVDEDREKSPDVKDANQSSINIEESEDILVYTDCKDHCTINNGAYIYEVVSLNSEDVKKTITEEETMEIAPCTKADIPKGVIISDCVLDLQASDIVQPVLPIENNRQQNYYITIDGKGEQCLMKLENSNFGDKNDGTANDSLWKIVRNDKGRRAEDMESDDTMSESPPESSVNFINIVETSGREEFHNSHNHSTPFNSLHLMTPTSNSMSDVKLSPSCGYRACTPLSQTVISHISNSTNLVSGNAFLTGIHQPLPFSSQDYEHCPLYPTPQLSSTPYRVSHANYKHTSRYSPCITAFCSMNSSKCLVNLTSSGEESTTSSSEYSPSCYLRVPQNTPESKTSDSLPIVMSPSVEVTARQFNASSLQSNNVNTFGSLENSCRFRLSQESSKLCHNEKERLRRNRIKNACTMLQKAIPGLSDKTDKATLLEVAVRYLYHLKTFVASDCDKRFIDEFTL